jgi:hypothetical protein
VNTKIRKRIERRKRRIVRRLDRNDALDADGAMAETTGECKQGMDINHQGQWGSHPLVLSLANTGEPLFLVNRSGNRPLCFGLCPAILMCYRRLPREGCNRRPATRDRCRQRKSASCGGFGTGTRRRFNDQKRLVQRRQLLYLVISLPLSISGSGVQL